MNNNPDLGDILRVGYTRNFVWDKMQRANQRIVYFQIAFHEPSSSSVERDYRRTLETIWSEFLENAKLSASILHSAWHPERGHLPNVIGWVWRQREEEELLSLSEAELFHLSDLLRANQSTKAFKLTEQMTTDEFGKHRNRRKLRLSKGEFIIDNPEETA